MGLMTKLFIVRNGTLYAMAAILHFDMSNADYSASLGSITHFTKSTTMQMYTMIDHVVFTMWPGKWKTLVFLI